MTTTKQVFIILFLGFFTACNMPSIKESTSPQVEPDNYLVTKSSGENGSLYGIIVADTNDGNATSSSGAKKDKENMTGLLDDITRHTGLRNEVKIIDGNQFSKQQIISVLAQVSQRVTTQDLVIFYYSGHGGRDLQEKGWPDLCVAGKDNCQERENRLNFQKEVIEKLKMSQPRLLIAIADTCNKALSSNGETTKGHPLSTEAEVKPENYRELFLESKGSIIFASANIGQVAVVLKTGSEFTNVFIEVLKKELTTASPSWKNIGNTENGAGREIKHQSGDRQQAKVKIELEEVEPPPRGQLQLSLRDLFQPGEKLQFSVTAQEDGYFFIFNAEVKDNSTLHQVFPSRCYREQFDKPVDKNELPWLANEPLVIPNNTDENLRYCTGFKVSKDPGTHFLIALLVTQESDLRKVQSLQGQPIDTKNGQAEVNNWFTSKLPGILVAVVKYQVE